MLRSEDFTRKAPSLRCVGTSLWWLLPGEASISALLGLPSWISLNLKVVPEEQS
jgi:hypothetical protein